MDDTARMIARLHDHLSRRLAKIEAKIDYLDERLTDLEERVEALKEGLESIRTVCTAIREDIGVEARRAVERALASRGVSVSLQPAVIEGYRFDMYGSSGTLTLVGRAYVVAGSEELERLRRDAETARRLRPELFQGRLLVALYALRYDGEPPGDAILVTPSTAILPRTLNP